MGLWLSTRGEVFGYGNICDQCLACCGEKGKRKERVLHHQGVFFRIQFNDTHRIASR